MLAASVDDLEVIGVFNPGVAATPKGVVLLVRVAEAVREKRAGYYSLPRYDWETKSLEIDWMKNEDIVPIDQRVVARKDNGQTRLTFVSHLRVVHSRDGRSIGEISNDGLYPATPYEEYGVEDPRITPIDGTYWLTYVAVSRHGAATALASTRDFRTFQRHGIIFPPENKDVVLFPEKIGNQFWALHRPNPHTWFAKPEMWTATSPDLCQWRAHEFFLGGDEAWEIGRVGGGTPPLRRPEGWVTMYHGNSRREGDPSIGIYSAGAVLLDAENPRRILARSGQIFAPETEFEKSGFVPGVVFPTGWVDYGETVLVYYGAGDAATAVAEFSWRELMGALTQRI